MRDSRVTVWTNPTTYVASDTVKYGPTIDLLGDYAGSELEGTSLYGVGIEWMVGNVTIGNDADGFTVTLKWQDSDDGSAWLDAGTLGTIAFDDANGFTVDGTLTGAAVGGVAMYMSRQKMSGRIRTNRPYARLAATAADVEGTCTFDVKAWVADGTNVFPNDDRRY